jgi:predicted peptidase
MKKLSTLFVLLSMAFSASSQDLSLYEKQIFVDGADSLQCRILTPANYKKGKKYPLLVFLHGAGERGSDNEKQLTWGAKLFLDSLSRARYPAIVVFPQCPVNTSWAVVQRGLRDSLVFAVNSDTVMNTPMRLVLKFVDQLSKSGNVDKKRIYIGGLSMGGMGTFDALARRPDLFAAAFPICGAGDPKTIKKYKKGLPIWVFHGGADNVVPVSNSRLMVGELTKAKANVKYTEYPGVGHNSWDNAFAEQELLPWLFAQKKK